AAIPDQESDAEIHALRFLHQRDADERDDRGDGDDERREVVGTDRGEGAAVTATGVRTPPTR
ncbi:hypothetical protein CTI14_46770, partial [Methylobacterium radiotolerans]